MLDPGYNCIGGESVNASDTSNSDVEDLRIGPSGRALPITISSCESLQDDKREVNNEAAPSVALQKTAPSVALHMTAPSVAHTEEGEEEDKWSLVFKAHAMVKTTDDEEPELPNIPPPRSRLRRRKNVPRKTYVGEIRHTDHLDAGDTLESGQDFPSSQRPAEDALIEEKKQESSSERPSSPIFRASQPAPATSSDQPSSPVFRVDPVPVQPPRAPKPRASSSAPEAKQYHPDM